MPLFGIGKKKKTEQPPKSSEQNHPPQMYPDQDKEVGGMEDGKANLRRTPSNNTLNSKVEDARLVRAKLFCLKLQLVDSEGNLLKKDYGSKLFACLSKKFDIELGQDDSFTLDMRKSQMDIVESKMSQLMTTVASQWKTIAENRKLALDSTDISYQIALVGIVEEEVPEKSYNKLLVLFKSQNTDFFASALQFQEELLKILSSPKAFSLLDQANPNNPCVQSVKNIHEQQEVIKKHMAKLPVFERDNCLEQWRISQSQPDEAQELLSKIEKSRQGHKLTVNLSSVQTAKSDQLCLQCLQIEDHLGKIREVPLNTRSSSTTQGASAIDPYTLDLIRRNTPHLTPASDPTQPSSTHNPLSKPDSGASNVPASELNEFNIDPDNVSLASQMTTDYNNPSFFPGSQS